MSCLNLLQTRDVNLIFAPTPPAELLKQQNNKKDSYQRTARQAVLMKHFDQIVKVSIAGNIDILPEQLSLDAGNDSVWQRALVTGKLLVIELVVDMSGMYFLLIILLGL